MRGILDVLIRSAELHVSRVSAAFDSVHGPSQTATAAETGQASGDDAQSRAHQADAGGDGGEGEARRNADECNSLRRPAARGKEAGREGVHLISSPFMFRLSLCTLSFRESTSLTCAEHNALILQIFLCTRIRDHNCTPGETDGSGHRASCRERVRMYGDPFYPYFCERSVLTVWRVRCLHLLKQIEHLRASNHLCEYRVFAVERRLLCVRNEELRSIRVRFAAVCHAHDAPRVMREPVDNLIRELLAPNALAPLRRGVNGARRDGCQMRI